MADNEQEKPKVLIAVVAAGIVTLSSFAMGNVIGWASPATMIYQEKYNMSDKDIAWISSISIMGGVIATFPAGIIVDHIGRKWTILNFCPLYVSGWLIIALAEDSVAVICLGRLIQGFCMGVYCVVTPIFVAEIAHSSIRGSLGVFFQLQLTIGILFAYSIGLTDHVVTMSLLCALVPIVYLICMALFIKETPVQYIMKKANEKAMQSLKFYRGKNYKYLDQELDQIKEYANNLHRYKETKTSFKNRFLTKATIKAFIIGITLQILQQMSGINAIVYNIERIFQTMKMSMSARVPPVIVAVIMVLSTSVTAIIIDKIGRRKLIMFSLLATGICNVFIGLYFKVRDLRGDKLSTIWSWMLVISVCVFFSTFSLGLGPMPWLMIGELFAPEVKGPVVSVCAITNGLMAFTVVKFFTPVVDSIGVHTLFWIFGTTCFLGVGFIYFVCIETKGKTLDEIQKLLDHRD